MKLINTIKIRLFCKKIGSDEFNNSYYEEKHKLPNNKKKRRYVIYNGLSEPSKVPSEWHCWLHYTTDKAPVNIKTDKYPWQKIHLPNLTGTKYDHFLSGRIEGEGKYSALVHAIIKQESGFAVSATSSVGATGFMQLMPDTAKHVAKKMGVKYNQYELSNNIEYNISLGSYYIKSLVDQFDGSELLAIAAYNAGPHNAKRWVKEFYDPREEEDIDKVIDWIELITYSETRNYVQRIMENLIVYKYLMSRTNYDDIK